ncbi:MAG: metalloregulator ArsR/SmtB family transcription factor [Kibdelosporangium sp.]
MLDQVAGAIADPVRREILLLLRAGPLPAGEIADRFTITRPAISRHLRVLRESGLVRDEPVGRQRMYVLDGTKLATLSDWIAQFADAPVTPFHLDALETEVYRTRKEKRFETATDRPGHPHAEGL